MVIDTIPALHKTSGNTLFNGAVTGTGDAKGIKPTAGSNSVTILALITMANAADLTLSIVTADDADGTTPVAIAKEVIVYKNDVRQTDAKSFAVTDASGSFTVAFCVPSVLIPAGKYICLSFANSNDANILSAVALDQAYYSA